MAYIPPNEKARLLASLQRKQAQLETLNTTIDSALENGEVSSYKFNSGEGEQAVSRRKLSELVETRRILESEIQRLANQLGARGVVNLNLRRRR